MYKILQLTDLHFESFNCVELDVLTKKLIQRLVKEEKPNFIAITGDLVWSEVENSLSTIKEVISFINDFKIPFGVTFGNHDSESVFGRDVINEILLKQTYFTDVIDKILINDRLNYVVEIEDSNILHRLYFIDSGDYDKTGFGEYAYIYREQIEWLVTHEKKFEGISQLFIHIPLPEYNDAKVEGIAKDNQEEHICAPNLNTGLFSELYLKTSVQAIYCGHDHDNDFTANYHGIKLNYGRVTGYNTYGKLNRGCRVIEIDGVNIHSYIVE